METKTSKYNVYLRIKPLDVNSVDDRMNTETLTATRSAITTKHNNKKNETVQCQYNFQKVFKPSATQADIFDAIVCPRLIDFWQGNDSLVFSYGTSNSGKSFTMQGTPAEPGVIPRVLHSIFQSIESHQDGECYMAPFLSCQAAVLSQQDLVRHKAEKSSILENLHDSRTESLNMSLSGTTSEQITMVLEETSIIPSCLDEDVLCSVWISFYEIYNENIYDLLAFNPTSLQNPLKLGLDKEDDSYHPMNLKVIRATSWDDAYNLYRYGKRNLRVAETLLNRKSSRSHCVFAVKLLTRAEGETDQFIGVRSFILCDLAGSERMKHTDDMGKAVVKEMLNINASILTLNKCFVLLKSDSSRPTHEHAVLPYRDSKLTMLFKKFLIGHGQLTMVANISQEADMYYQTEQVLKMTSLAYKTRVEKKRNEKLAFKLPLVMPKRRFSTMIANEQISPVSGLRSISHSFRPIPGSQTSNSGSVNLVPELIRLKTINSELEEEIKNKDLMLKALNESVQQKDLDLITANKNEADLLSQITHLENRLSTRESSADYFRKKTFELEEKYRKRVQQASMKELEYHERLTNEQNKLEDLINVLKLEFGVSDTTGPLATVQQVVYLHRDAIEAATEELVEYENLVESLNSQINSLHTTVAERDDEIANLKGRLMELEASREMEEIRNNNKCLENSEADDEITTCQRDYELFSSGRVKSHGNTQWISDDESSPLYMPPKSKTTVKKKKKTRTKMVTDDVPYHGSCVKAKGDSSPSETVRRARRKLLGHAPDYLGNELQLDHTLPDAQMSPGSIMKKTLRSGKRLL